MKRLAFLAVIALAVAISLPTAAAPAPKSNWTALNAALAPVNVALRDHLIAFGLATSTAATHAQALFAAPLFDFPGQRELMASFDQDLDDIRSSMASVKADAKDGIAVLDSFAPERCSAHFVAVEYTMFAAWLEVMTALQANEPALAYGTAVWLSGVGRDLAPLPAGGPIDLEWNRVQCAGAEPSPSPKLSAGPEASR